MQWLRHRRKSNLIAMSILVVVWSAGLALARISSGLPAQGLTAYGEPCTDPCMQRGFPYTWCHKKPSRNGTWIDRDYCSPGPGITRYLEPCVTDCEKRDGRPFYWCGTRPTSRGSWDYCSPFSLDSCNWSAWGSWSACSATCGSRSSRTRRRRMESGDGKVRHCSGEIEQSIRSCRMPECPIESSFLTESPETCEWSSWSEWSDCSVSCGQGGKQTRSRSQSLKSGQICEGDRTQTITCHADPCEEIIEDGETTTFPAFPEKVLLGELITRHHRVSGKVFSLGQRRLKIEDFVYDGTGPDAFFWVGTKGEKPSEQGHILPYPFNGQFYAYDDFEAPVLGRFDGEDLELLLPPQVELEDIRWISVWCRRFTVSFGDLVLSQSPLDTSQEEPESSTKPTKKPITTTKRPRFSFSRRPPIQSNVKTLPELPRRIEKNDALLRQEVKKLKDRHKEKADKEGKDPVPFTVIRVSSSVSQVRPEFKVDKDSDPKSSVKTSTEKSRFLSPAKNDNNKHRKFLSRDRPPFLRPVAKFPDIKIPEIPPRRPKVPIIRVNNNNNSTRNSTTTSVQRPTTIRIRVTTSATTAKPVTSPRPTLPRNLVTVKLRKPGELFTRRPTTTKPPFTRIPLRANSIFVTSRPDITATTAAATTTINAEEGTTESPGRKSSISSEDFRSPAPFTTTEGTTTTVKLEPSSISSDTFRGAKQPDQSGTEVPPLTFVTQLSTTDENFTPPARTTTPWEGLTEGLALSKEPEKERTSSNRGESRFKPKGPSIFGTRKPFLSRTRPTKAPAITTSFVNRFRSTTFNLEEEVNKEVTVEKPAVPTSSPAPVNDIFSPSSRRPFLNRVRISTTKAPKPKIPSVNRFRSTRAPKIRASPTPGLNSASTVRLPQNIRSQQLENLMKGEKVKAEKSRDEKKLVTLDYPIDIDDNLFDYEQDQNSNEPVEDDNFPIQEVKVLKEDSGNRKRKKGFVVKVPKKVEWNPIKTQDAKEVKGVTSRPQQTLNPAQARSTIGLTKHESTTPASLVTIQQTVGNLPKIARSTTQGTISSTTSSSNGVEEEDVTEALFVTPFPALLEPGYDPCSITDACGPNAKCTPRGSEPICSCPVGFSGIPRDGTPDPAHGCVRTPEKCVASKSVFFQSACPEGQSCVKNFCLPQCQKDTQCALGERCVNGNCIKICFYDAHCLAGEFCEKTGNNGNNGVCLSGCRRDTNCPFGQICVDNGKGGKKCESGCHFNNDCNVKTACVNGSCTDPCIGFSECGTNAVCEVVSHAATCKCPSGYRELNSPYVACVPDNMNLARIECLKNSDCPDDSLCQDWKCTPG